MKFAMIVNVYDASYFVARNYLRQVVKGLLYLHSHGILHRDITLANLLLTRDMDVVSIIIPMDMLQILLTPSHTYTQLHSYVDTCIYL